MESISNIAEEGKRQSCSRPKLDRGGTRQTWRLLNEEYEDPVVNLTLEEAIIDRVTAGEAPSTLRFWRNHKIVVVIGKFQVPELEVNGEVLRKCSATVIRRFTGGGTVYTDIGTLNYSISVDRGNPIVPRAIAEIAPTLTRGVVEGLRRLGLNAEFEPEGIYVHVNGKKISGAAGLLKRGVAFIHGTILVNSNLETLNEILNVPPYPPDDKLRKYVKSIHRDVTSIEAERGKRINIAEAKKAIKAGFAEALNIELREGALLKSELSLSMEMSARKHDEIMIYSPVSS